jgi:hypothetical protein
VTDKINKYQKLRFRLMKMVADLRPEWRVPGGHARTKDPVIEGEIPLSKRRIPLLKERIVHFYEPGYNTGSVACRLPIVLLLAGSFARSFRRTAVGQDDG